MNTLTLLQEFGKCLRTPTPETLDQAEILARRSLEIIESLEEFPLQDQAVDLLHSAHNEELPRLRLLLISKNESEVVTEFRSIMQKLSEGIRLAVDYGLTHQTSKMPVLLEEKAA